METYYIGIGASAGGLEALEELFQKIPSDSNHIYIVIQHLSPDYKSMMNELLARHTKMPIHIATDGMETEPNHVYLIPPSQNLSIFHSKLYLESQDHHHHLNMPIDVFFKSLAQDQGKYAIGIILSGTGSDGTKGIRSIKEEGGMVIAQSIESSKFDGMPKSAISTELVDYITPPSFMPEKIMRYIASPSIHQQLLQKIEAQESIDDLTKLIMILRTYSGVDFSSYKENTMIRRIDRRIKINRCEDLKTYVHLLSNSDREKDILYKEMLIGVTSFFRDPDAYEILRNKIIPYFDFSKGVIRIWSAGCSTGEEVYSIAIAVNEYMEKHKINCELKIFATDIDQRSLEFASIGYYLDSLIGDLSPEWVAKYFTKKAEGYQICDPIRKQVVFAKHNILKDPPFSKLDLLVCRNVFIYFKSKEQQKILGSFYYSLYPKGYLWLGSSESIGDMSKGFDVVNSKWKFYKYLNGYDAQTFQPSLNTHDICTDTIQPQNMLNKLMKNPRYEHILAKLLAQVLPPSLVVDNQNNIVHVLGETHVFFEIQPGRFSNKVSANFNHETTLFINNCIRKMKTDHTDVLIKNALKIDQEFVDIQGRILHQHKKEYYVISFIMHQATSVVEHVEIEMNDEVKVRVEQLEHELQLAREGLQSTIEELEASNEELQSSNEELIASNEELQSTNEELQSVNEELFTVNSEYQLKIEELTSMTNDLSNLLKNTEVGALYLDNKLCIRKITSVMSKVTHIRHSDIGRPINHLATMKSYPEMFDDIQLVLDTLHQMEREIRDEKGDYWLIRIRPYRTEYNAIGGVILTVVDITNLKQAIQENVELSERLNDSLASSRIAWWEYNVQTGHVIYSDLKATMLGYTPEEFPDEVHEICRLIHPEDYERAMNSMRQYIIGESDQWNIIYRIRCKNGQYKHFHDKGTIVEYEGQQPVRIIGTVVDVTDIKAYVRRHYGKMGEDSGSA